METRRIPRGAIRVVVVDGIRNGILHRYRRDEQDPPPPPIAHGRRGGGGCRRGGQRVQSREHSVSYTRYAERDLRVILRT